MREGRVDCAASCHDIDAFGGTAVKAHDADFVHFVAHFLGVGRNPQNISSLGQHLQEKLGMHRLYSFLF